MEHKIREHFKELTRGLMHNDSSAIYSGYSGLYGIGPSVLPLLEDAVLACDVTDTKFKELSRYVSGLVSLIHDIDETKSTEVVDKIINRPCSDHIRQIVHSITQFSKNDFNICKVKGIEVIEDKGLKKECDIIPYIDLWLGHIPADHLEGLVRIVICKPEDIEAAGTYMPILQKVSIGWDNDYKENSLSFKLWLLITESTFYHEIGHHALRHSFGQIPQQEKEANRYSASIMNIAHPQLGKFIKLLKLIKLFPNCKNYRTGC